ncbi:MAG: multiheme c-type cytochrome [Planctomycetota bacterium]
MLVAVMTFIVAGGEEESRPTYVGLKGCVCHKLKSLGNQVGHWKEKDPHSRAYESLKSEKARKTAEQMGVQDPMTDKRCVECHATAFGVSEAQRGDLKMEDGIACEGCHGPGSKYSKKPIMIDREEAIAKGLVILVAPEQRQKVCGRCHNKNVPKEFYKERDFVKDWEPIKHSLPQEEH